MGLGANYSLCSQLDPFDFWTTFCLLSGALSDIQALKIPPPQLELHLDVCP